MNMRDLKEMMLVIAGGAVGVVSSWNRTTVFVHFWHQGSGCFEDSAAACPRDRVQQGGSVSWQLPTQGSCSVVGEYADTPSADSD